MTAMGLVSRQIDENGRVIVSARFVNALAKRANSIWQAYVTVSEDMRSNIGGSKITFPDPDGSRCPSLGDAFERALTM